MLRDLGHFTWLPDGECYRATYTHEMVQLDGRKMSKHLGNTVTPQEIVEQIGADTLRFAMLYAAAPAKAFTWDESLLTYSRAFLRRLWTYAEPRLSAASSPPRGARPLRRPAPAPRGLVRHRGRARSPRTTSGSTCTARPAT